MLVAAGYDYFWRTDETVEGCRIDVQLTRRSDEAFLDTWFSDGGIEDTVVATTDLKPLVELIYTTASDREIAAWLGVHGK